METHFSRDLPILSFEIRTEKVLSDGIWAKQIISLWIIPTEQSNGPAEYSIDDVTIDPFLFSFEENDREFTYSGLCGYLSTREELLVLGTDPRTGPM